MAKSRMAILNQKRDGKNSIWQNRINGEIELATGPGRVGKHLNNL
jgi:hypothetical protein